MTARSPCGLHVHPQPVRSCWVCERVLAAIADGHGVTNERDVPTISGVGKRKGGGRPRCATGWVRT